MQSRLAIGGCRDDKQTQPGLLSAAVQQLSTAMREASNAAFNRAGRDMVDLCGIMRAW